MFRSAVCSVYRSLRRHIGASLWLLACFYLQVFAIANSALAASVADSALVPTPHPFLADSHYTMLHANAANTDAGYLPGPVDSSRTLREDEIIWKPLGPGDGWEFLYSGPYADGRQVIWAGGSNALYKLDADTLGIISTYVLRRGNYYSQQQVTRFMDEMNVLLERAANDDSAILPLAEKFTKVMVPVIRGTGAFYRMVSNDNEHYQMTNDAAAGTSILEVYGDAVEGDPDSAIVLKRSWQLPQPAKGFSAGVALNMTYDGWVIIATHDGYVYAVSRDLKQSHQVFIPGADKIRSKSWMAGFIRNGIAIDDDGGIYLVTQDHMHRLQWTGSKLSMAEKDGAWQVAYPNGKRGSGTTPSLLGWGEGNDKLVLIADGDPKTAFRLYWRGKPPADWQAIPGESKQLAAKAPVTYGDDGPDTFPVPLEASISTYGYGFFTYNDYPHTFPPKLGNADANIFANVLLNGTDRYALKGGVKYQWNPDDNSLELAWTTSEDLGPSICSPTTNNKLYCMARKNGGWTMQSLDWQTGESGFYYQLSNDVRFNPGAAVVRIAPNGAIDCPCGVGWGMLRLQPDKKQ